MPNVGRATAIWTGFSGAPGYTRMSFGGVVDVATATNAVTAMRAFFTGLTSYLRTGWSIQVQPIVELHDIQTGLLQGEITASPPPAVVNGAASAATTWSGGVGATITWKSLGFFNGHRVKGRTYLVPLVGMADVDGTLNSGALTAIQTAADTLLNASNADLAIWSKQYSTSVPPQQVNGMVNSVTSAVIGDRTGVLRSRRD